MTPLPPVPAASGAASLVLDAARDAFEHTRRQLFPVRLERWFVLGFLAFLDQCGRGHGGLSSGPGSGNGDGGPDTGQIAAWLASHVGLVVALATVALALVVALVALVLWINTRGIFMYLDAVVTGRVQVRRPWREHADAAGSLFVWRFALALGTLLVVFLFVAAVAAVLLGASGGEPAPGLVVALAAALLLVVLPVALAASLVSVALRDFVAPLQLHLRDACPAAARVLSALVRARPGVFALYVLLKIVFALAAAALLVVVCCFTCCLALLPVISQTLLQPLLFFERAWSVGLLRRLGFDLFASFPGLTEATPQAAP